MRKKKTATKKPSSILDKAKPVKDMELFITALFYGRSGTGKTTISGSYPKPMLVIDIGEKGTDSLLGEEGIDVIHVDDWGDIEEIYWELKNGSKYKTVTIDALHSMQGLALNQAKIDSGKKITDQTSQRDFGQAGGLMVQWCSHYRDLKEEGIHINFIAHEKVFEVETEDDEAIAPEIGPRLMPSVSSAILGMVNVVGNTYIRQLVTKPKKAGEKTKREIQYCLRIGPNAYYATKARNKKEIVLPEFIVDPTYDKLVDVLKGSSATTSKRKVRRSRNGS